MVERSLPWRLSGRDYAALMAVVFSYEVGSGRKVGIIRKSA
jgi:hypothetical protein